MIYFSTDQRTFLNITLCAGACPGGGGWPRGLDPPLEIEKQKKKGFQILGPSPYKFLDTRLVCMLYCIIYCIIIMFPSFLIHEKTTFCYVMEGQKKINHLENLDLDM